MEETSIVPFEWLTNFNSLSTLLDPDFLFQPHERSSAMSCVGISGIDCQADGVGSPVEQNMSSDIEIGCRERKLSVLHVGCGSSTLGEQLCHRFHQYRRVVNIDIDKVVLSDMAQRWEETCSSNTYAFKAEWKYFDFKKDNIQDSSLQDEESYNSQLFDIVIDKSTIDCALCSDDATTGLICNVYAALKCDGVYFVVSFHHADFILPLLRDCPGADWDVEHHIVKRSVDEINPTTKNGDRKKWCEDNLPSNRPSTVSSSWSSGVFAPDAEYRKSVNVFICRRKKYEKAINHSTSMSTFSPPTAGLNRNEVRDHIHFVNNKYFKEQNPMVTSKRKDEIERQFKREMISSCAILTEDKDGVETGHTSQHNGWKSTFLLPLRTCYDIMFVEEEKEHLDYELFLEDWNEFNALQENDESSTRHDESGMTFVTSIKFLETMQ